MITVANRVYVTPEYSAEFEERFRSRAKLVDGMPGFISNQVLRPVNEGDPYVVLTLWESRDNFTDWIKSDEFIKELKQTFVFKENQYAGVFVYNYEAEATSSEIKITPPAA